MTSPPHTVTLKSADSEERHTSQVELAAILLTLNILAVFPPPFFTGAYPPKSAGRGQTRRRAELARPVAGAPVKMEAYDYKASI